MWFWNGHQWLLDPGAGQLMLHLPYRGAAAAREPFRLSLELVFHGAGAPFRGLEPARRPRLHLRADDFTVARLAHWERLEGLKFTANGGEAESPWQPGVSLELQGRGICPDAEWHTPQVELNLLERDGFRFGIQLAAEFAAEEPARRPRPRLRLAAAAESPELRAADRALAVVTEVELAQVRVTVPGEVRKPEDWARAEAQAFGFAAWNGVELLPPPLALKGAARKRRTWTVTLSRPGRSLRRRG